MNDWLLAMPDSLQLQLPVHPFATRLLGYAVDISSVAGHSGLQLLDQMLLLLNLVLQEFVLLLEVHHGILLGKVLLL